MGKFDTDFSSFGHGKSISQSEVVAILKWAEEYVERFDDPYVDNVFTQTLKKRYLSDSHLERIEKRMDNIPLHKEDYIGKFLNPVKNLMIINDPGFSRMTNKEWTLEDADVCKNMLETFKKWNYLTDKQIKFIVYLFNKKFSGSNRKKVRVEFGKDSSHDLNFVLTKNFKKSFEKTKGGFTAEKFVEHEAEEKKKEIISKGFMTLDEIRKKLSV